MGLFNKKSVIITTLHINERLQPEHRVEYYEGRLQSILKKEKIGQVVGGGSTFFKDGGIANCDINIDCYEGQVENLVELLRHIPFAKGTKLIVYKDGKPDLQYSLGHMEGIGIYLNGVDLPAEVYKNCNIDYVVEQIFKLLETPPILYSYWQGDTETALYFYSVSFTTMRTKISNFLATYPLCSRCRVTQIA